MPDGVELAVELARFADDKQAEDIVVLDLQGISTITDFFVICTGTSLPHLKAVRREIMQRSGDALKQKASAADGTFESHWLVLDYGDVIVHIFHKDKRDVYALEDLWSDAPRVEWNPEAAAGVSLEATAVTREG
ncbi:MAG: ribosome silencing factor [Verrucomicrobiales bacterium]|nr:ribosome silencing factor [Verrucomicrobiae bacterium]